MPHYALFSLSVWSECTGSVLHLEESGLFVLWPCGMFGENRHLFPQLNKGIQAGLHFAVVSIGVSGCAQVLNLILL